MKIMKRIATALLAICLIVPCFSMVSNAAEGVIFFTDLETKVGDTFNITGTVVSKGGTLKNVSVGMSYDAEYMQFMSGDGINADSAGKLTYTGNGSSDKLEFTMTFQALKEGETRLNQDNATVTTTDGEELDCTTGYSDVTVGAGDPSKITQAGGTGKTKEITIDGQQYSLSEAFSENEIPTGFAAGEITYEGETYKGARQEAGGLTAAYLVDSAQAGEFWLYDEAEQVFSPCEEILISDEYSIIVLDGRKEIKMPEKYDEGTMEINGKSFPVWQDPDRDGFYILYAANNEGDKSLYLYDSLEHTYQRMETPKAAAEKKAATGLWSRISEVITGYLIWFVVGIGCILLLLAIFLIVMAIKLHHRNVELDDLYDEYGIDEEPQYNQPSNRKKSPQPKNSRYRDDEEDDFDDYYEDDEYYDDEDDEYYDDEEEDDDDLADLRRDFTSASGDTHSYDEYYDEEDFDDAPEEAAPRKSKKKKDDTFTMDFIDLD